MSETITSLSILGQSPLLHVLNGIKVGSYSYLNVLGELLRQKLIVANQEYNSNPTEVNLINKARIQAAQTVTLGTLQYKVYSQEKGKVTLLMLDDQNNLVKTTWIAKATTPAKHIASAVNHLVLPITNFRTLHLMYIDQSDEAQLSEAKAKITTFTETYTETVRNLLSTGEYAKILEDFEENIASLNKES
ncbi:MAG: hypothetical protein JNK26_02700 [Candidatus Doudnabacteria bacterium]|nr:hypothetical protein [Candidatus Doudnabacteria bacterium]